MQLSNFCMKDTETCMSTHTHMPILRRGYIAYFLSDPQYMSTLGLVMWVKRHHRKSLCTNTFPIQWCFFGVGQRCGLSQKSTLDKFGMPMIVVSLTKQDACNGKLD